MKKPFGRVTLGSLVLHPFLLTMYAVLAPLAANIGIVGVQAIRSLGVALLCVAVLLPVVRFIVRDRVKAALLVSGAILLVSSYGHVARLLAGSGLAARGAESVLLVIWLALAGLGGYGLLRRVGDLGLWNGYLNAVGAIALVFPLYAIMTYTRATPALQTAVAAYRDELLAEAGVLDLQTTLPTGEPHRDIYYIILDGYARADVLESLYGLDNTPFVSALQERGFYVPAMARANYADTVYSLSSSLNMAYISDAPEALRPGVDTDQEELLREALAGLIQQSRVAGFLKDQGYETVAFDSGYRRTTIEGADILDRSPDVPPFNATAAFELMLMDTTLGRTLLRVRGEDYVPLQTLFDDHRGRVLYALTHLSDYADRPGAQYVFAHVISPHAPYVFGSKGEPRQGVDPFTLLDRPTGGEWSPALYRDQVIFVNTMVLREVDEILAKSDPDPIIVLQADHSSRAWGDPTPSPEIRQQILFPIFAAFYLPGGTQPAEPYPEISPVNVFRLVMNRYFGTRLPILPDESFVLVERGGHRVFQEACEAIGGCGPSSTTLPAQP